MKKNEILKVENVSKKFTKDLKRSMAYGVIDSAKSLVGIGSSNELRKSEFWALKNVNFTLNKGETVGLMGRNGSGKSTLLRIINGIFPPDQGQVSYRGKMGALIAVGAGFHQNMTGRENIYLNGTILGMSRAEIDEKMQDIIEFADIGDFLEAPVSSYSSGMKVRLGFAIAIHGDIELLLADEVLAVGDVNFQKKCFEKILELRRQGLSTVFVSHSISTLERFCDKAVLLDKGEQVFAGDVRIAVKEYMNIMHEDARSKAERKGGQLAYNVGVGNFNIDGVEVSGDKANTGEVEYGGSLNIKFDYHFKQKDTEEYQIRVGIRTAEGIMVQKLFFHEKPFKSENIYENEIIMPIPESGTIQFEIPQQYLHPQAYVVDIAAQSIYKAVHEGGMSNAAQFTVVEPDKPLYLEYGSNTITDFPFTAQLVK